MPTPRKPRLPAKLIEPPAPPKDVQWIVSLIKATPAKQIGIVYAPDEATAIARAIEQYSRGLTRPIRDSGHSGP